MALFQDVFLHPMMASDNIVVPWARGQQPVFINQLLIPCIASDLIVVVRFMSPMVNKTDVGFASYTKDRVATSSGVFQN